MLENISCTTILSKMWQTLTIVGFCLVLLVGGTPTAQAQRNPLVVQLPPKPLNQLCVGGKWPFFTMVFDPMPVFSAQVTLSSEKGLANIDIEPRPDFSGTYRLFYQPTKTGADIVTIAATWSKKRIASRKYNVKVIPCREAVTLTSTGTYSAPTSDGGTSTANAMDLMDKTIIKRGPDGKYTGTGDVFFSQQMSFFDKTCGAVSTTAATATVKVDIQGALDDSGEVLTLNTIFHNFSAGWTVSGCGASVTTQNPNMGDLNGYLNLAKFDVAADGGSLSNQLSFPGWSGEGTAMVTVYPEPEEDQGSTFFIVPSQGLAKNVATRRNPILFPWVAWLSPTAVTRWVKELDQ